jgi:hypothetical protein
VFHKKNILNYSGVGPINSNGSSLAPTERWHLYIYQVINSILYGNCYCFECRYCDRWVIIYPVVSFILIVHILHQVWLQMLDFEKYLSVHANCVLRGFQCILNTVDNPQKYLYLYMNSDIVCIFKELLKVSLCHSFRVKFSIFNSIICDG